MWWMPLFLATSVGAVRPLPPHMFLGGALRPPYVPEGIAKPDAQWIDQKLDHFKNTNGTWKQRYFASSTWWDRETGPVFILLGGEGPASSNWIVTDSSIMINAKKYKALVFVIEHRFYGESHPTDDTSIENLKYLSSRQALADFAHFHDLMVVKYKMTPKNKWVCFGGSYAGALAAWLRQLYPNVVIGAVASSAPVLAKLNFFEYVEVVEKSLEAKGGADCPANVTQANSDLSHMLQDKTNWPQMETLFSVKPPLYSERDAVQMISTLAGNFEVTVQYNRDESFRSPTIKDLCHIMTNKTFGSPLERYAAVNKLVMHRSDLNCRYEDLLQYMMESSWESQGVIHGVRQWHYQKCTEFGFFKTTDSNETSLFSNEIDLDFFNDVCSGVFGINSVDIYNAVNQTNNYYGGRNITGTNIIFPNGSIDPWHALSILKNIGSSVYSLYITGTSHCADMYAPSDSDPPELTAAREEITTLIGKWLAEAN